MQERRTEGENAILISVDEVRKIFQNELEVYEVSQVDIEIKAILKYFGERSGLFIPRGKGGGNQEYYAFSIVLVQIHGRRQDGPDNHQKTILTASVFLDYLRQPEVDLMHFSP